MEGIERVTFKIGLWVDEEIELSLLDVDLVFEEAAHVGHVFEESRPHQRLLADEARNLRDLVDKVEDAWWDVDNFTAHDLKELAK